MMHPFLPSDILLPQVDALEKWAVIACDQFVSQPDYWEAVQAFVGDAPSALKLILPESELEGDCVHAIETINQTMNTYLHHQIFRQYNNSFIYVERTLLNGSIRKGVVGAVDLEQYDYAPKSRSAIRATEETVPDRLPPRMDIRRNASLELPHVLLLCDDEKRLLIESLSAKKDTLPPLYDFQLMAGGGRIRGWLVSGTDAKDFVHQLNIYEMQAAQKYGDDPILYAVGDGNHSLASAKGCYEELKQKGIPSDKARYALVELENIHDSAQVFEPIHRIITKTDPAALLDAMVRSIGKADGIPITWCIGDQTGHFFVQDDAGTLPVGIIQNFLDCYLLSNAGTVDYIHGDDTVRQLAQVPDTIGLILPPVEKNSFFRGIIAGGTLPRKTFSMGHAQEKRYYLEARRIKD